MTPAQEVLRRAVAGGRLVRSDDVSRERYPLGERTYLSDGTGLVWDVPPELRGFGAFAVDAERVAPVRTVLTHRYGVEDEWQFARFWTRAEALAKVFDVPIVVWLQRYGLGVPAEESVRQVRSAWAWVTEDHPDHVVTRSVLLAADSPGIPRLSDPASSLGALSERES